MQNSHYLYTIRSQDLHEYNLHTFPGPDTASVTQGPRLL